LQKSQSARISYRGYFFSHESSEPPHIHVDRDGRTAKFWLEPIRLAYNLGFRADELRIIERLVTENAQRSKEAWNDFFDA